MLIPAFFALLRVRLTLALLPWPRAERALARPALFVTSSRLRVSSSIAVPDRARQAVLAHAVQRASRVVPGSTCLVQAIALKMLLAREGKTSVVRLGISAISAPPRAIVPDVSAPSAPPREPLLNAHAWLECDGVVLLGDPRGQYAAFPAIDLLAPRAPRLRVKMPPQ